MGMLSAGGVMVVGINADPTKSSDVIVRRQRRHARRHPFDEKVCTNNQMRKCHAPKP